MHEAMQAGRHGRTFRVGRHIYVDLTAVERAEGRCFSEQEIELASGGLPDRIITFKENA